MFPYSATAASLVPSLEDVMPLHFSVLPVVATSVQLDASEETSVENESRATSRNLSTLRRSIVRISVVRLTLSQRRCVWFSRVTTLCALCDTTTSFDDEPCDHQKADRAWCLVRSTVIVTSGVQNLLGERAESREDVFTRRPAVF